MLFEHAGHAPQVDEDAWVAPNAAVCGDVTVGAGCRILYGAQVIAESGSIVIGRECIVMENAVLRSSARNPLRIGRNCLIGPNAHVAGCTVGDESFIATGAAVFHGVRLGAGCEVRVNAVVHVNSTVAPGSTVPIGWIAVGRPAQLFPPDQHDAIWAVQEPLDFPGTVYGLDRADATTREITRRYAALLSSHRTR